MFNLAAHVLHAAETRPEHIALEIAGGETLRYGDLAGRVRGIAAGLRDLGLAPGDRVLMRLGNTLDFPLAYLGAIAADLIPIPTSSALTAREVTRIAQDTRPALVIHGDGPALPETDTPRLPATRLRDMEHLRPADYVLGDPERPAYIIYTSGTSGQPRAVVHAHRAILARRMMWDGWYGLRADDRLMHAGAFNWTYTLGTGLMDPWSAGATALIPAPDTAPEALPDLIAQTRATLFAAAPGVYRRLLRAPVPALTHLRHGLSAGEKLPSTLRRAWEVATGTPIHEAFGMSECSTFISGSPARPAPGGALGYPQPGRRIALIDGQGEADHGVIAIHRSDPGLMLGYLDQPEETAQKFLGDWFLTGDMGHRDASGAIHYDGRADDMMNAGGTRVSPVEVEDVLTAHPAITEVACAEARLRDDLSLIAAFYVAPDVIHEDELTAFARQGLASYKVPRIWVRVDVLPRGANNKLLRAQLRRDWEARHGQA